MATMPRASVIASLVILPVLASACGGPSDAEKASAAKASQSAKAKADASASASAEADSRAREQKVHDDCEAATGKMVAALKDLNSRLSVGLTPNDYSNKVGDVRVAYDAMVNETGTAGVVCVQYVMTPLESALNKHVDANSVWSTCIDDFNCDPSKAPTLSHIRKDWTKATKLTTNAQGALDRLAPGS